MHVHVCVYAYNYQGQVDQRDDLILDPLSDRKPKGLQNIIIT